MLERETSETETPAVSSQGYPVKGGFATAGKEEGGKVWELRRLAFFSGRKKKKKEKHPNWVST